MKKVLRISLLMINSIFFHLVSHDPYTVIVQNDHIVQTQLSNGLTVLVCPKKDAAVVSVQLWYKVGSNHEKDGERGIAHFIEHMIFKGTQKLSESDITLVTSKLSGNCNAFTGYEYTGYLFNIPVANWDKVLPIMADCMENCSFKQEHLNSELKAVIQELKMRRDNHLLFLEIDLISNIFESHPYHYSTIGFKQDLWSVNRDTLLAFYKKHYSPDNAVMVVVGDVNPQEVHEKIEESFGSIPAKNGWNDQKFYVNEDIKSKLVRVYRDVKQSICCVAYVTPGIVTQNQFESETFTHILANGRGSRLYKLLVDELQLVANVNSFVIDLFDKSMIAVDFSPKNENDIDLIVQHIQHEIDDIAQHGPTLQEVERAMRFAQIAYQQMFENSQKQAYTVGKSFVANRDPLYPFQYGKSSAQELVDTIKNMAATYCISTARHQGEIRAIPEAQVKSLNKLQKESDEEDSLFLDAKKRESAVEEGRYVHSVVLNEKKAAVYSKPENIKLDNGLELLWLHSDVADTIEIQLNLQANSFYEDEKLQGIASMVSSLLLEGTKNHPGQSYSDVVESYGISFSVTPGQITTTILKQDFPQVLALLTEMLTTASFDDISFEKVKKQAELQMKKFWETPTNFSMQLARQVVYQQHPYHKNIFGSDESLAAITLQDCIDYYKKMITPQGASLTIVGNLADYNVQASVEKTVGQWQGSVVESLTYPTISQVQKQSVPFSINRDQIVLAFVGLSVDRFHEDYDKILLFDQIFIGGTVRTMTTRLFQLRVRSGLFYTIGGSLLTGSDDQPGMMLVRTIVSQDRAAEAEKAILQEFDTAIDSFSEEELAQAKSMIINSFDLLYDSHAKKASTFAFLKKYNLPFNYFETRLESLQKITVEEVKAAVKKIVSSDKIAVIQIGRV